MKEKKSETDEEIEKVMYGHRRAFPKYLGKVH